MPEPIREQVLPAPDEAPLTWCPWCDQLYSVLEESSDEAGYEVVNEQEGVYRHCPMTMPSCGNLVRFKDWAS